MTASPPTLAEQIEAVEWAMLHLAEREKIWPPGLRDDSVEDIRRGLEAAAERLRAWEFVSAIAR